MVDANDLIVCPRRHNEESDLAKADSPKGTLRFTWITVGLIASVVVGKDVIGDAVFVVEHFDEVVFLFDIGGCLALADFPLLWNAV